MRSFRASHNCQQRNEEKIFQGICWPWRRVLDFEFIINHSWRGREKNSRGNIPGEQIQTSLAHGQSRSTWLVVSGLLRLGQLALTSDRENDKYCQAGNQSCICIDFQLNTCNFFLLVEKFGSRPDQADAIILVPDKWESCATGGPKMIFRRCGGMGKRRSSKCHI